MSELYENLLRATDNTNDITNEKYGTVVKINGALCSVLEEDTNLEHTNVPVLNQIYLETGDKVVIGFVDNSIYNPVVLGVIGKERNVDNALEDMIDTIYPIGSIYMSVNSTSPSTLFGGTWEQINDTFLLSSGDTYSNGATGGSATVTVNVWKRTA